MASLLGCLLEPGEAGWLAAVLLAVNRPEGRSWVFMPKRGLRDTGIPSLSGWGGGGVGGGIALGEVCAQHKPDQRVRSDTFGHRIKKIKRTIQ